MSSDECRHCGMTEGVEMEDSRTAYQTELPPEHPDNPNAPVPLCRECAATHHTYWDDVWAEYFSSVGV